MGNILSSEMIIHTNFPFSRPCCSHLSSQEQIYKLMENDIYPRYLKSEEYNSLLQKAKEAKLAGKGFFAKLQKKKFGGVMQDATEISPCLPHRFARSHVREDLLCRSHSSKDIIYEGIVSLNWCHLYI